MSGGIPFNRPSVVGRELEYVAEAVRSGHISGDGLFTRKCAELLEREVGAPKVLLTTSCTHALEMAALLLEIGPGDEVVLPSFTFVSTANAFVLRGCTPVFVEIREDTLNLDEQWLKDCLTSRTKAIAVVHYAGVGCEMDSIERLAAEHGVVVVEDNAQGLFGRYKGRHLGTFGALAALSFHETKNFTGGEGGALIINDPRFVDRAEVIREKGTNRGQFFRGQVDKYTWVDIGSSYLPSELVAAFLYGQLEASGEILRRRRFVWEEYARQLTDWGHENGVRLPYIPPHCEHPWHLFYLLLPSLAARQALIAHLKAHDILSVFHYVPLHLSPMGQRWGYREGDFPVTERASECLVRLPLYNDLDGTDLRRVIDAILAWRP